MKLPMSLHLNKLVNILGGSKLMGAHKSSGEFLGEHDSLTQLLQKNKQTNKNKR